MNQISKKKTNKKRKTLYPLIFKTLKYSLTATYNIWLEICIEFINAHITKQISHLPKTWAQYCRILTFWLTKTTNTVLFFELLNCNILKDGLHHPSVLLFLLNFCTRYQKEVTKYCCEEYIILFVSIVMELQKAWPPQYPNTFRFYLELSVISWCYALHIDSVIGYRKYISNGLLYVQTSKLWKLPWKFKAKIGLFLLYTLPG